MENNLLIINTESIRSKIHTIRGVQVMLDTNLAGLYHVDTKRLNEQVRRNIQRFPENFMFQLTKFEKDELVANCDHLKALKFSVSNPFAFTEQGVAMLSGILRSETAIKASIQIMNTFVAMRRFISSNSQIFTRLDIVEKKQIEHDKKFDEVFDAIESKDLKPEKGIFFDGQMFDAYTFVSDLVRSAKKSIILIDNYIDDSVLTLFIKRNNDVSVKIYTQEVSRQLILDLAKYNSQYPKIEIKEFHKAHDRFLIIDDKEVYHFGASLKDLGKKWFGFSKFDKESFGIMERLED